MKLIRCHVENFGKLSDFDYSFADGLNCLRQDNGWGKTTLASFIKAMFYGLPVTTKKNLVENERKKYTPWQGGNYGGNLIFEIKQKQYRIERFFGKKEAEDVFNLIDLQSGKKSQDYTANIGLEIFDLDADAFERSTYIPQKDLETKLNESIVKKLTNLIHGTQSEFNYESACEILDKKRVTLSNNKKTGQIQNLTNQIENLTVRMHELVCDGQTMLTLQKQVAAKETAIDQLVQQQQQIKAQINTASAMSTKPNALQSERRWLGWSLLVLAVICFVGSVLTWRTQIPLAVIMFVLSGALFGAVCWLRFSKKVCSVPGNEEQTKLAENNDVMSQLRAYEQVQKQIDFERGAQTQLQVEVKRITDEMAMLDELENQKLNLQNQKQVLEQELSAVKHVQEFLAAANQNLTIKYLAPMKNSLSRYLALLTGCQFGNLNLDTDFNVAFEEFGQLRVVDYYSQGYQNLINLCLRLALIDALFHEEKPVIILDDPFVNLDDDKVEKAKQFLQTLAQNHQLIYFTCHKSRC